MSEREERWTIIKDGRALIEFTSMLEMSMSGNSSLPDEPLEKGSFATYNRTQQSDSVTARLGIEGDAAELQRAQDTLRELKAGTETFSLATPDYEHKNLALEGFDYVRDVSAGSGILIVDLRLKEIREVETASAVVAISPTASTGAKAGSEAGAVSAEKVKPLSESDCKEPSNVGRKQTGKTQTADPTPKQRESIAYKVFGG